MLISELIVTIVASLGNLLLGSISLYKNPKSHTNRLFFCFTGVITLYLVTNYFAILYLSLEDERMTLFFVRIIFFLAFNINLLFYLFSVVYPQFKTSWQSLKIKLSIAVTALLSISALTPFVFEDIKITEDKSQSVSGIGMPFLALHTLIFIGAGIFVLIRKYRKFTGIEKMKLAYLLLGAATMITLILISNLFLVMVFNITAFVGYLPIYTLIFIGAISYTIIKYRFFDIKLIIAKSIAYFLMLLFIGLGSLAILFDIAFLFQNKEPTLETLREQVIPSFLALFFAVMFQPIRQVFEKSTNKLFFKDRYQPKEVIWNMSRVISSTLDIDNLSEKFLTKLFENMRIQFGSLVLLRGKSISFIKSKGVQGVSPFSPSHAYRLIYDSYYHTPAKEHFLVRDELNEGILKNILRNMDMSIVIPIHVNNKLLGGLFLGDKLSGEIYSTDDFDLLKIITPEFAIALSNAISYQEIANFNKTLKDEVQRATIKLRRANERLKELDQLKDEFVSIASHELRTPMTAVKSYLWMAINQPKQEIHEPLKKYLSICFSSTERLIHLVNDMLTVSRIERKKIELNKEVVLMSDIVQAVFDELLITAKEKGIELKTEIDARNSKVYGDKEKLREVVQNILGNALKFTPQGGLIKVVVKKTTNKVHVEVSDTGSGIQKEDLPKLFQKFSKIEYSYSKHSSQPGTGLGLYISKQIVTLHGGNIQVESEVGKGSTFDIQIPFHT
jgi:signal transduction histidine kinase